MFDTMTLTKVTGALCGSLLVFLLGGWAADVIYEGGGEGEGEAEQAFTIETGAEEVAEVAEEGPPFAELLAVADVGAGEKVFSKCKACHKIDGSNGTGPYLNGVVGRTIASIGGYAYSEVLAGKAPEPWSPDNLNAFLINPKIFAPGTKMSFAGLRDTPTRINLIAWLRSQGSGGFAIPAPDPTRQPGAAPAAAPAQGVAPAATVGAPATGATAPATGVAGQATTQTTPAAPPAATSPAPPNH